MKYVAILHHIFLSLDAEPAILSACCFALILDKVIVGYCFSFDEALLKVCVYNTCCLRRFPSPVYGPGSYFLDACGEVSNQVQELVGGTDETIESWLCKSILA